MISPLGRRQRLGKQRQVLWGQRSDGEAMKKIRKMESGKVILLLFCCVCVCVRAVALLLLHGLASSLCLPTATGGCGVTCNQCWFGAKDETPLLLPAPPNEETRVLTTTICHKSGTDILFPKKDSPILSHITHTSCPSERVSSKVIADLTASLQVQIDIASRLQFTTYRG